MGEQSQRLRDNPAADAAGLLLRIGFGLLVLAAPFAALFSRRSFVILVPVGALLIVTAALVQDARGYFDKLKAMIISPIGLMAIGLGFWLVLSLGWTPFPGAASERIFRTLGNAAMTVAVCAALPERMRASNLNLMSIGIAMASIALVLAALFGSAMLKFFNTAEVSTLPRAAIAAGVLVWPALSWTITRGRDIEGILLIAACGIAAIASGSPAAAVVLFVALLVVLVVRVNPVMAARFLSWLWLAIIMVAPALPFAARALANTLQLGAGHLVSQIGLWSDVISRQPVRLLTGHGFDTLQRARAAGVVDAQSPLGLLPEVWHDLGLVGAVGLSAIVFFGLRRMAHAPVHVAAASIAVTSAILVFLIIDVTATQQWWLSICVVVAITMTAVHHGQYRTRRPSASILGRKFGFGTAG